MSPKCIVLIFAWISITALGMHVISDVWIPLLLGAIATAVLAVVVRK